MLVFLLLAVLTLSSSVTQENNTDLEQRVEILEVEVEFLTDEVEEIEVDVNQLEDQMTVMEETVIGNTNDISDLTNSVEDTEDTIVVLLARMESLEAANDLLQETIDLQQETMEALQETVDILNNTVIALQSTANTTNDRLQEVEINLQDTMVRLANVDEEVQTHDTDIVNLDETMVILQASMSDLEDIVDSVEDDVTALNVENDEIQQRLIVLEEILIVPWVACASSPCDNGGSCFDVNVDTFICMCRDGYFGIDCEQSYHDASFLATFSVNDLNPTNPIVFDANRLNPGGHYDNTTGIYTVPLDGIYQVIFHILSYDDALIYPHLVVDGNLIARGNGKEADYLDPEVEASVLMSLTVGQQVWADNNDVSRIFGASSTYMMSWFSAHLVYAY